MKKKKVAPAMRPIDAVTIREESYLAVFMPSGEVAKMWGIYRGLMPVQITEDTITMNAGKKPVEKTIMLPRITVTREFNALGQAFVFDADNKVQGPKVFSGAFTDPTSVSKTEVDALKEQYPGRKRVPAGNSLSYPVYAVIVDLEAKDPGDAILYAPPMLSLPKYPLWPSSVAQHDIFPSHIPMFSDWKNTPRRYRYFMPEGTTGTVYGVLGFQLIMTKKDIKNFKYEPGMIPGSPAVTLHEPATAGELVGEHKVGVLPMIRAGETTQFGEDWVIIDEEAKAVVYYPPHKSGEFSDPDPDSPNFRIDFKGWPSDVLKHEAFPDDTKYAGTMDFVSDWPGGPREVVNAAGVEFSYGRGFASFVPLVKSSDPYYIDAAMGSISNFADAEWLRQTILTYYDKYPRYCAAFTNLRSTRGWIQFEDTFKGTESEETYEFIKGYLQAIPESIRAADIVLWNRDLVEEAVKEHFDHFKGVEFTTNLTEDVLQELKRPQLHIMQYGSYAVEGEEARKTWGMESDSILISFVLVPVNVDYIPTNEETEMKWDTQGNLQGKGKNGFYIAYHFMPLQPEGEKSKDVYLTAEQAFVRCRWSLPQLIGEPIESIYVQACCLLKFMASPRIEINPTIAQEADAETRARLEKNRQKYSGRTSDSRYLTLRRVEVPEEISAPLLLNFKPAERTEQEAAHYVKTHWRTVKYGPGKMFSERRKIEQHKAPKDKPLAADAEERLKKRQEAETKPRFIRVVR